MADGSTDVFDGAVRDNRTFGDVGRQALTTLPKHSDRPTISTNRMEAIVGLTRLTESYRTAPPPFHPPCLRIHNGSFRRRKHRGAAQIAITTSLKNSSALIGRVRASTRRRAYRRFFLLS